MMLSAMSVWLPMGLALLLLVIAMRLLFKGGMLAAVMRAVLGLAILAASALSFFTAYDLMSYRPLFEEQAVVTLQFQKLATQRFRVVLVDSESRQYDYYLDGDQWQLDARLLRWRPALAKVGFEPLYRLERLSGRYADLHQQLREPQTAHQLGVPPTSFDSWALIKQLPWLRDWVDAQYGSATFLPMADGAVYEVKLAYGGMLARPVNDQARAAVNGWQ
jgi:hypothetical protein